MARTPFEEVFHRSKELLESKAKAKGYSDGDTSRYKNELMAFTEKLSSHALGEIVYKAVRYDKKKEPEDLLKIIAWACLKYLEDGHLHGHSAFYDMLVASANQELNVPHLNRKITKIQEPKNEPTSHKANDTKARRLKKEAISRQRRKANNRLRKKSR